MASASPMPAFTGPSSCAISGKPMKPLLGEDMPIPTIAAADTDLPATRRAHSSPARLAPSEPIA